MMYSITRSNQSLLSTRILVLLNPLINYSTTNQSNGKCDKDTEQQHRLVTTKKMRLLGLQSNQARKALALFDDYVYKQKQVPDIRMFAVAINCAMIAEDLTKGREIHQLIERDFPYLIDNLMLKQQLRYFYLKCSDPVSANKLFHQSSTTIKKS